MKKILQLIIRPISLMIVITLLTSCAYFSNNDKSTDDISNTNENNQTIISNKLTPKTDFDTFTTIIAMEEISTSPLNATFTFGNLESMGLNHLRSELDDLDQESFSNSVLHAKKVIDELKKYTYEDLTYDQQLTYDMIDFQYSLTKDFEDFYYYDNIIQPTSGIHINLPLSLMQIEFSREDDIIAYIERVEKLPKLFDQVILFEEEKAKRGLLLPEDLYDVVIQQIDALLVEPKDFLMVQSFKDRLLDINISSEAKSQYILTFQTIVAEHLYPAYERLKDSISTYKHLSKSDKGLASWKNGKSYYELIIKNKTSYNMDAEELKKWAHAEQLKALNELIYLYENDESIMIIETFNDILPTFNSLEDVYDIENQCLNDLFYDYDIRLASENIIPSYLEDHLASGFYFPVSLDGLAYGNMFLRSDTYEKIDYYTLNLYFHENIPGHHLYFNTLANSDLPMIRKVNSWLPYEEGWAIYIEKYAYDYIGLEPNLVKFMRANDTYFNYTVMLLDIDYHYYGESRETIINKLLEEGYNLEGANALVNRMIANPGEVIHYYYGGYKMDLYLDKCQEELGSKFNIKAFHDLILKSSGLPFTTVDRVIDEWIASQK